MRAGGQRDGGLGLRMPGVRPLGYLMLRCYIILV